MPFARQPRTAEEFILLPGDRWYELEWLLGSSWLANYHIVPHSDRLDHTSKNRYFDKTIREAGKKGMALRMRP